MCSSDLEALLHEVFQNFDKIITLEDATTIGGMGTAVLEFMNEHQYQSKITMLGIPDKIVEHGSLKELHHECHYDAMAIIEAVKALLGKQILSEV